MSPLTTCLHIVIKFRGPRGRGREVEPGLIKSAHPSNTDSASKGAAEYLAPFQVRPFSYLRDAVIKIFLLRQTASLVTE